MFGGGPVLLREELRMWSAERIVVARKVSLQHVSSYTLDTWIDRTDQRKAPKTIAAMPQLWKVP